MVNKKIGLGMLVIALVFGISFTSCGTIMKAKTVTVKSESGTAAQVTIEQDGINLYSGPLPARIDVSKSGALSTANPMASIKVNYTDKDGNPATFEIKKTFNWWVLGDIGGAALPIIIDIVTGSVFTFNFSKKVVPISYNYQQPEMELWLVDYIPPQMLEDLTFVGNMGD
jgi:hypothetical protein